MCACAKRVQIEALVHRAIDDVLAGRSAEYDLVELKSRPFYNPGVTTLNVLRAAAREVFDDDFPDHFLKELFGALATADTRPRLPHSSQSSVYSLSPKVAALCFDRVWAFPASVVPADIAFYGGTELELRVSALSTLLVGIVEGAKLIEPPPRAETITRFLNGIDRGMRPLLVPVPDSGEDFAAAIARTICRTLAVERRVYTVPFFDSTAHAEHAYKQGDRSAVVAALTRLAVVDEHELSWDQVREVRADVRSRKALRRLIHWLDGEMLDKSYSYIADEIEERVESYEAALRKHGVKTVVGALRSVLDSRFLAAGALSSFLASSIGGISAATAAAGAIIVGKVSLDIAQTLLDLESATEESSRHVAFIIDLPTRAK